MKDPLRNNKIKSTKKQKTTAPINQPKKPLNAFAVSFFTIAIVILIGIFVYRYFSANIPEQESINQTAQEQEFQEQKEDLERLESQSPRLTESQRRQELENFFQLEDNTQ